MSQRLGEFYDVRRSGISVQSACQRQTHAAPGLKVADLLIAERLDCVAANLRKASVVLMLGERRFLAHVKAAIASPISFSFAVTGSISQSGTSHFSGATSVIAEPGVIIPARVEREVTGFHRRVR